MSKFEILPDFRPASEPHYDHALTRTLATAISRAITFELPDEKPLHSLEVLDAVVSVLAASLAVMPLEERDARKGELVRKIAKGIRIGLWGGGTC